MYLLNRYCKLLLLFEIQCSYLLARYAINSMSLSVFVRSILIQRLHYKYQRCICMYLLYFLSVINAVLEQITDFVVIYQDLG